MVAIVCELHRSIEWAG